MNSPRSLIGQLVSYSLWIATIIALTILFAVNFNYYAAKDSAANYVYVTYVFAVALALAPIAYWADLFYAKIEPAQKQGFAKVVVVISSLLVFLVAVGALIAATVGIIALLVSGAAELGTKILVCTSLFGAMLSALLFARIAVAHKHSGYVAYFPRIMLGLATVLFIFVIFGPVSTVLETRQDRLIEQNLEAVDSAIYGYYADYHKLPDNLEQTGIEEAGAKALVARELVEYQRLDTTTKDEYGATTYHYTLCVTYQFEKGDEAARKEARQNATGGDGSASLYDIDAHDAGRTCYKLSQYVN